MPSPRRGQAGGLRRRRFPLRRERAFLTNKPTTGVGEGAGLGCSAVGRGVAAAVQADDGAVRRCTRAAPGAHRRVPRHAAVPAARVAAEDVLAPRVVTQGRRGNAKVGEGRGSAADAIDPRRSPIVLRARRLELTRTHGRGRGCEFSHGDGTGDEEAPRRVPLDVARRTRTRRVLAKKNSKAGARRALRPAT